MQSEPNQFLHENFVISSPPLVACRNPGNNRILDQQLILRIEENFYLELRESEKKIGT